MKPSPLVSIVIPCYNYGRFLAEAIKSAQAQTYPSTEIIVVNDGSTDETEELAKGFGGVITYFKQANMGLSATRNRGAQLAKGEFVVYLDADDILEPNYLEACLAAFTKEPSLGFVYTQMQLFGREEKATRYPDYNPRVLTKGNFAHASAMIKTSLVRRFGYDETFKTGWEDWDFYLTLLENGYTGRLVDQPLLKYRKHDDASSMIDDVARSLTKQYRLLLRIISKHPKLYSWWAVPFVTLKYLIKLAYFTALGLAKKILGRK